jgi:putative acetyltransferase
MHIRLSTAADTDAILAIWLDASVTAHSFVDPEYWASKVEEMRDIYLPAAVTYVIVSSEGVAGFLSLAGDTVAALFVSPDMQGRGFGSSLLSHVKIQQTTLTLGVYKDNLQGVAFYQKHGFVVVAEQIETHTGHTELVMRWCAVP